MKEYENLRPTDDQWLILNEAMELLKPFGEEERVCYMCFFRDKDDNEFSSEYDCCTDEKCIKEAKKSIRRNYGNRTIIEEVHTDTSSDYESFDKCSICYCYFNEFLTWVNQEFNHHEESSTSIDNFKSATTAYELRGIYESLHWNCDHQISGYCEHQYYIGNEEPLNDTLKTQQELIDRVVKHASLVIEVLGKGAQL